jgi:hypothetical protein
MEPTLMPKKQLNIQIVDILHHHIKMEAVKRRTTIKSTIETILMEHFELSTKLNAEAEYPQEQ